MRTCDICGSSVEARTFIVGLCDRRVFVDFCNEHIKLMNDNAEIWLKRALKDVTVGRALERSVDRMEKQIVRAKAGIEAKTADLDVSAAGGATIMIPTLQFRWYQASGSMRSGPVLQQRFDGTRGDVWLDIPTVRESCEGAVDG